MQIHSSSWTWLQLKMARRLSITAVILLATLRLTYSTYIPASETSEICMTPGCVEAAGQILSNLDENVDPCQDFYKFACGGWLNNHDIDEDKSEVSVLSEVGNDLNVRLRGLVEKEIDGTETDFIKMLKDFYGTCMDINKIEESGAEPLKRVLKTLGGWPVVEGREWDDSKFDWIETLISFRKIGYGHTVLLDVDVTVDLKNNSIRKIYVDESSLGMPDRSYLLRGLIDPMTAGYYKMMVKSAKLLGADEDTAKNELLKVLEFEMALANITVPQEEKKDFNKMYNKYTVKQLQEEVPQIPWLKCINGMLIDEIYENETVIVTVAAYPRNIEDLISKTEKRVVANYMLWRVVGQSLAFLSKEYRDIQQEYVSSQTGNTKEQTRWEFCLADLNGFGIALSAYYVRHYFKEESKDAALEIVNYIRKEFLRILHEVDWMDELTKEEALAKANAMMSFIGYPKELMNDTAVSKVYENLTITRDSYLENSLKLNKWTVDSRSTQLRKPNIKREWKTHANVAIVNAFYNGQENTIDIPAGILQNELFNKDRPQYLNFAAIGFVAGHEVTHGFDSSGRQFDKEGNVANWWGKTTDELFQRKAQCIIDQYSNYTAENGLRLNGILTQAENIADNGGLKEAYRAYHSWAEDNGREPLLPGLDYSLGQLFFISAANAWCGKQRPQAMKLSIITDDHTVPEFRIRGSMSNFPEFAREFNCPLGTPMNRKDKCEVW